MAQQFFIDPRRTASYLAVALAACAPGTPGVVVPADAPLASASAVQGWVAPTMPSGHQVLRFRWQIQDDRGAAGGRGSARIAGPDSVRLDVVGPLGAGRGAAVVVGDSAEWTDPPDVIRRLVPSYPLMWAMFGVMRLPPGGAVARGVADSSGVSWQWNAGPDTVRYQWRQADRHLVAEARRAGRLIGRVDTDLEESRHPARSRLVAPDAPARLNLTFSESRPSDAFTPDLWIPGRQ